MIYKRATARLRAAGITTLNIEKRLHGATPHPRTVYLCRGAFCYGLDYPPTTERPPKAGAPLSTQTLGALSRNTS